MQSRRDRQRRPLAATRLAISAALALLAVIVCRCTSGFQRDADREAELDQWASTATSPQRTTAAAS